MLIAYEDQNYRSHGGVDWASMLRAAGQYAANGHIVSGASTLTMQVARLIESEPTRNLAGKLRQMVHAGLLEGQLTKDQILTLYLTLAPYGGNIEGIRAATLAYFGKEPARLTTAEAALLVALPQSPEARRPDRDAKAAGAARNLVLDRMVKEGVISLDEAESAKREPVPTAREDFPAVCAAPRPGGCCCPAQHSAHRPDARPPPSAGPRKARRAAGPPDRRRGLGGDPRRRHDHRRHPRLGRLGRPLSRTERRLRRHDAGGPLARLDAEAA